MKTYDELYKEAGFYWGREPNDLCKRVLDLFPSESRDGRTLLDIGSGEGRDLIRFAKNGLKATGLDLSREGIRKSKMWAEEEGVPLTAVQGDINEFTFENTFDIIYSSGSITFIPPEKREEIFSKFRDNTSPGGVNAFNVFVEKPFLAKPPDVSGKEYQYKSGELMSFYWDWEILYSWEEIFDCDSSNTAHRHAMDTVIARRIED